MKFSNAKRLRKAFISYPRWDTAELWLPKNLLRMSYRRKRWAKAWEKAAITATKRMLCNVFRSVSCTIKAFWTRITAISKHTMSSPKKMAEYLSAVRPTKRRRNLLLNGTKQSTNPWQHGTKSIGRNIKRQNSIKRTVKTQTLRIFSTRPNSAAQRQGSETM